MVLAMSELLPCVEMEPEGEAVAAVVWLHGLGANGHDFVDAVPYLGLPADAGVRFVFPHAPSIAVTLNGGMVMPAWYDIRDMDLRRRHDEDGVRASALQVEALLAREQERGVPAEKIILAGFSQGGAIAFHVGLRYPKTLAGIVALSTYLVCEESLADEVSAENRSTPIFQGHGTMDPMVVPDRGEAARSTLEGMGYDVRWHDYPMAHQVCLEELQAIGAFLRERLGL